jgi:chorismate synthase
MQKYGYDDARPVLERASARETAARVALGTVAKALLEQALQVQVISHVVELGSVAAPPGRLPEPADLTAVDADPVRCLDPATSVRMVAEVDAARADADTLGGIVEILAYQLPPGLGSYAQWDRRLDGRVAAALMSIPAIKGVEFGDGFTQARSRGSAAHDEIEIDEVAVNATAAAPDGATRFTSDQSAGSVSPPPVASIHVRRRSGRAGGVEGGMSTGDVHRVRAAMKPISSLNRPLSTVDVQTGQAATAINQRSDVCAVPAAAVVAEAMIALVLADLAIEKFGGDSLAEMSRNARSYLDHLAVR